MLMLLLMLLKLLMRNMLLRNARRKRTGGQTHGVRLLSFGSHLVLLSLGKHYSTWVFRYERD